MQKAKRKKSTQLGHEEEERVMRILHKLVFDVSFSFYKYLNLYEISPSAFCKS